MDVEAILRGAKAAQLDANADADAAEMFAAFYRVVADPEAKADPEVVPSAVGLRVAGALAAVVSVTKGWCPGIEEDFPMEVFAELAKTSEFAQLAERAFAEAVLGVLGPDIEKEIEKRAKGESDASNVALREYPSARDIDKMADGLGRVSLGAIFRDGTVPSVAPTGADMLTGMDELLGMEGTLKSLTKEAPYMALMAGAFFTSRLLLGLVQQYRRTKSVSPFTVGMVTAERLGDLVCFILCLTYYSRAVEMQFPIQASDPAYYASVPLPLKRLASPIVDTVQRAAQCADSDYAFHHPHASEMLEVLHKYDKTDWDAQTFARFWEGIDRKDFVQLRSFYYPEHGRETQELQFQLPDAYHLEAFTPAGYVEKRQHARELAAFLAHVRANRERFRRFQRNQKYYEWLFKVYFLGNGVALMYRQFKEVGSLDKKSHLARLLATATWRIEKMVDRFNATQGNEPVLMRRLVNNIWEMAAHMVPPNTRQLAGWMAELIEMKERNRRGHPFAQADKDDLNFRLYPAVLDTVRAYNANRHPLYQGAPRGSFKLANIRDLNNNRVQSSAGSTSVVDAVFAGARA
jgi:hypothetical protein